LLVIRHGRQYSTYIHTYIHTYIQYNAKEKVSKKTYAKNGKDIEFDTGFN